MSRRHDHVINIDDLKPEEGGQGHFGYARRRLGPPANARALGCTYIELPLGKTAFPYHFHSALEEALYILDGTGSLRIGTETVTVRAGDFITLPPGPAHAHQLTNDGSAPLRYLAMSSPASPVTMDIVGYPDSKKFAFASGIAPGSTGWRDAWVMKIVRQDQPSAEYYEDEPLAQK